MIVMVAAFIIIHFQEHPALDILYKNPNVCNFPCELINIIALAYIEHSREIPSIYYYIPEQLSQWKSERKPLDPCRCRSIKICSR